MAKSGRGGAGPEADPAARERAEAAFVESEKRYRVLFESAWDGIAVFDDFPDGTTRLVDCNGRYAEMAGRSREELLGAGNVGQFQIDREGPEKQAENRQRAMEGTPYRGAFSWIRPDGKENHVEYTTAFMNVGGKRFRVGIDHDVTDLLLTDRVLRESQDKFRFIYQHAQVGIAIFEDGPHGHSPILDCNERYAEMSGRSRQELMELGELSGVQVDCSTPEQLAERPDLRSGRRPYTGVFSWKRPDGKGNYVEFTTSFIKVGGTTYRVGIDLDVTERVVFQRALAESEAKYRFIFENAQDGIAVFEDQPDEKARLLQCNDRYVELSGYTREELLAAEDTTELAETYGGPEVRRERRKRWSQGEAYTGSFSWKRPDRKENYIEFTAAFIQLGQRRLRIGIDHDITDHVLAERKLRERGEQLKGLVGVRTMELAVEQQTMAAVGLLAAGIAHEFNNFLSVVGGSAELGRMGAQSAEECFDLISQRSQRAAGLVRKLVTFSQQRGGEPEEVPPRQAVEQILDLVGSEVEAREIELEQQLGNVPPVMAGPGDVERIALNLISNALEATDPGGHLAVELCESGGEVILRVADDGRGMTPAELSRVAEPFYSTKEPEPGEPVEAAGLGLAVAQNLAGRAGGRVEIESRPGEGTTVTVRFPVAR